MNELTGTRNPQRAIQHDTNRRLRFQSGQANRQQRIVRQHRTDADQYRIALRTQQMRARLCGFARDGDGAMTGGGDLVVRRHREF